MMGTFADISDVRWEFVEASMAALDRLRAALSDAEGRGGVDSQKKAAMLSVRAEAAVSSLLQAAIALGLLPSLLPGVGLAPGKRSKWARYCGHATYVVVIFENNFEYNCSYYPVRLHACEEVRSK